MVVSIANNFLSSGVGASHVCLVFIILYFCVAFSSSDILPVVILGLEVRDIPIKHSVRADGARFEEVGVQVLSCFTPSGKLTQQDLHLVVELANVVAHFC